MPDARNVCALSMAFGPGGALAVESHEVVHARDAGHGRLVVQCAVWSEPVVVVNKGLQGGVAPVEAFGQGMDFTQVQRPCVGCGGKRALGCARNAAKLFIASREVPLTREPVQGVAGRDGPVLLVQEVVGRALTRPRLEPLGPLVLSASRTYAAACRQTSAQGCCGVRMSCAGAGWGPGSPARSQQMADDARGCHAIVET